MKLYLTLVLAFPSFFLVLNQPFFGNTAKIFLVAKSAPDICIKSFLINPLLRSLLSVHSSPLLLIGSSFSSFEVADTLLLNSSKPSSGLMTTKSRAWDWYRKLLAYLLFPGLVEECMVNAFFDAGTFKQVLKKQAKSSADRAAPQDWLKPNTGVYPKHSSL